MDVNLTDFNTNVSISQVEQFFDISIANVSNISEVTQEDLFDLYEAYKTKEREQIMVYKTVAYVVGSLIILCNLTVVISSGLILSKGQQPKSTYLLLGNVSLADTIIGISLIFGSLVDNSTSSNPLCIFQIGMVVGPAMVSIFSVGLIAVDRYIYILHGLYYQRWVNTTRVRIGILCTWLMGIFIASLPAVGWTSTTFRNYRCWYVAVFPSALLIVVALIILTVVIIVCVLYFLILHRAVKTINKIREFRESNSVAYINKGFEDDTDLKKTDHVSKTTVTITVSTERFQEVSGNSIEMRELSKTNIEEKQNGNQFRQKISKISSYYGKAKAVHSHPSKLKAIKTVLLLIACFVGTWVPYNIAVIVYVKCDIMKHGYDCIPLEILTLGPLYMLGICNSLFDPIIYAWRHSGFKRTLKKIFNKCFNVKKL